MCVLADCETVAQLPEALAEGRESIQHYLQFYQVLVEIGELVISWDHLDRMWAALTGADDGLACASMLTLALALALTLTLTLILTLSRTLFVLKHGVAAFLAPTTHRCIPATLQSQHEIRVAVTPRFSLS